MSMAFAHDQFPMMLEGEINPQNGQPFPPVSVCFTKWPHLDKPKSEAAGHEVYNEIEYVRITVPGERNSLIFQPASDTYRKRFPKAYAAFKARAADDKSVTGLRIEMWPAVGMGMSLTLRSLNINTVEELAETQDTHIGKLGAQGFELRAKAQTFLKTAKDSAETMKIVDEKKAMELRIQTLQDQVAQLLANAPRVDTSAQPVSLAAVAAAAISQAGDSDIVQDVVAAVRRPRARASANA